MKVKVTFECEIYPCGDSPWFTVYDALSQSSKLDYIRDVTVIDTETNEEV